jgi:DNA polymerase
MAFVDAAMKVDSAHRADLLEEAYVLTGLDNPNSRDQLKAWLEEELDEEIPSLNKVAIKELQERMPNRVLEIRQELARSSISKYAALKGATCPDGRIKGTLLFCGAARTHRWAGRVFQPQNLPQNHLKDLALAREVVMGGNYHDVQFLFDSVSDTLSQLIRTAIIPAPGKKLIISDFSAIEARVAAWLAGEEWVLEVFRTHGKIYEATASNMFKVPLEGVTKELRQRGKVAVLALGYGGGVGALSAMDTNGVIPDEEKQPLVNAWRKANANIVNYWWAMDAAATQAVMNPRTRQEVGRLAFLVQNDLLFMELPSGNRLCYPRPRLGIEPKYGKEQVCFEGTDQKHPRWGRIFTYGPKFFENACQSVARDLLAEALRCTNDHTVLHVHDEVVMEVPMDYPVAQIENLMGLTPVWAKGLPLKSAGFETQFYMKE